MSELKQDLDRLGDWLGSQVDSAYSASKKAVNETIQSARTGKEHKPAPATPPAPPSGPADLFISLLPITLIAVCVYLLVRRAQSNAANRF